MSNEIDFDWLYRETQKMTSKRVAVSVPVELYEKILTALYALDEPHCNYIPQIDCTVTELIEEAKRLV